VKVKLILPLDDAYACGHVCDFCYKEAFFEGGRSFYTQTVDAALAEIERLPGRHLYFLGFESRRRARV
jgi:hypothetical protein